MLLKLKLINRLKSKHIVVIIWYKIIIYSIYKEDSKPILLKKDTLH